MAAILSLNKPRVLGDFRAEPLLNDSYKNLPFLPGVLQNLIMPNCAGSPGTWSAFQVLMKSSQN